MTTMSYYVFGIGLLVCTRAAISGAPTYERIAESVNLLMYLFCRKTQFDAEK